MAESLWTMGRVGERKEEEKRAERILWPKEVRTHTHTPLSIHARYNNDSIRNVWSSNEETKVRAANKYGYQCYGQYSYQGMLFPTNIIPPLPPLIGRIPRIIATIGRQTVLSTEENDNERFMKLTMIEGGKICLDLIFCLTPFNAIYSQFSLFPFCLSVLDCSLEICPGALPKLSVARNASTKGTV